MDKKIIALVGMCGSGKSEVADFLRKLDFPVVRFGDITDEELQRRTLERNPQNEQTIREELRQTHGMAVYAKLSLPKLRAELETHDIVIADGLYSMAEYELLRAELGSTLLVVAVNADRELRYDRLAKRKVRPFTKEESFARDVSEIKNLEKGGPIAIADYTLLNNDSLNELRFRVSHLLYRLFERGFSIGADIS